MTVGELKKAIELYLINGEESDDVCVLHADMGDGNVTNYDITLDPICDGTEFGLCLDTLARNEHLPTMSAEKAR